MGLIRDLSDVDRSVFGKDLSRYKEERKKAQEDIALRAQRATKTEAMTSVHKKQNIIKLVNQNVREQIRKKTS